MILSRAGLVVAILLAAALPPFLRAQASAQADTVFPTSAPRTPLPSEAATARVTKFSFIAYGDTRGRMDGTALQAEHALVIESMLSTIRQAAGTPDAIRFVLQSGDAVVNGSVPGQLTVSYVPLINRLTQEGGVPYFLAVGNHDVGNSIDLADPRRMSGLRNYFAANAKLLPADGSPRRLNGYPTFAFGYGNTFFVALDSGIPDDSTQFAWVKSQFEKLDRKRYVNIVVFYHHPPFSSGPHGGATLERQAAGIRVKWMPLFRRHHVKLMLTGHEHFYEHWVERYWDASGRHRLDEIVTAGGGAPHYTYTGEPDLTEYVTSASASRVSLEHLARPSADTTGNPYHYVVIHVDGEKISLDVVGVDWGVGFAPYGTSSVTMVDPRKP
jgi:hypothetical protein